MPLFHRLTITHELLFLDGSTDPYTAGLQNEMNDLIPSVKGKVIPVL